MKKTIFFYKDMAGTPSPNTKEFTIEAGNTWVITGISTTGSGTPSKGTITWNGEIIEVWQSDKYNSSSIALEGDGTKTLVIELSGPQVYIGCSIYYEELGSNT